MKTLDDSEKRLLPHPGVSIGLFTLVALAIVSLSLLISSQSASQKQSRAARQSNSDSKTKILTANTQSKEHSTSPVILGNYNEIKKAKAVPTLSSSSTEPTPMPTVTLTRQEKITLPTVTPIPTLVSHTQTLTTTSATEDQIWDKLALCESGGNWSIDTGNGYFGGLQFTQSAWESVGGTGSPADATREEQIKKGKALQEARGWGVWGACADKLDLV